jgi:predicted phosphodiesterase
MNAKRYKLNKYRDTIIKYYIQGKSDLWIANKYKVGERTVQRYLKYLRDIEKVIKSREEMKSQRMVDLDSIVDSYYEQRKEQVKTKWKIKKSKLKANKAKYFKMYLAMGDQHIPHQNIVANRAIFKLMNDIKFDGVVLGGDFMDMGPISHWNKRKKKTLETQRMKEDYIEGNAYLDEVDKRLPTKAEKYYLWGNHCHWYNQLIEEMPVLEGFFNPTEELHLKQRGYKVFEEENAILKLGRLCIIHGAYCNKYAINKHLDKYKTNIMFFHTHRMGVRTSSSPAREISFIGYNVPCLCNPDFAYKKNRPDEWARGFAIIYLFDNGHFAVDLKRIVNGIFVHNGKLYDGNK